jgi:protein pelota
MNIIKSDFKKGFVQLRITDKEDLWYLSHLIDPGDFVKGKTTRKVKIGDDENAKVTKKTLTLKIEAESVQMSEDSLRVNGKVKEGTLDVPKDSYHAISLEDGSEFIFEKVKWMEFQKQKLLESCEKKFNFLFCIFDREEALIALTQKFGYNILVKLKGDVPKKDKKVEIKKDFQQEIIKALEIYEGRYNPDTIILGSPAFYKEDLFKKILSPKLRKKIVLASCSDISETSLDEVLKTPELSATLKSSRSRKEKMVVDELLREINKQNLAVYGWDDVLKAIESGAVSQLLVSDEFIKQKREAGHFLELDECMKKVDSLQAEIYIISSEHEGGKKLDGIGGIAAILRYKI